MILKNFKINDEFKEVDLSSSLFHKQDFVNGFYECLGGTFVAIFLIDTSLFLRIEDSYFKLDGHVTSSHSINNDICVLTIEAGEGQSLEVSYDYETPLSTIFWTEDDEDVNFGVWISHIIQSQAKRDSIIETWGYTEELFQYYLDQGMIHLAIKVAHKLFKCSSLKEASEVVYSKLES